MMRQLVRLLGVMILLSLPSLARGQSVEHINQCTELLNRSTEASGNWQAIDIIKGYRNGTMTFGADKLKAEMLAKVEALEKEYSTHDLELLEEDVLRDSLKYSRQYMTDCADIGDSKGAQASMLFGIGDTLIKLKQADDAIPVLRRCVEIKPDFGMCWAGLAEASERLGRPEEAKAFYKKTIEIGGFDEANAVAIRSAKLRLFMLEHPGADPVCAPGQLAEHWPQCADYYKPGFASGEAANPAATHSFGTGFFVSKEGDILTNNHVVAPCRSLATRDGKALQVIARNAGSDLALLKADFVPSTVAVFRTGPAPKLGDTVVAFGFPLPGILSSQGNVSTGVLSATSGLQNDARFVQISAPVQPGNSGGPLFDSSGHVIGVVVAKLDAVRVARATGDIPQNVNFAVHWSQVQAFLDEQAVPYQKTASQRATSTANIAATAAQVSVAIDCTQYENSR